MQIPNVLVSKAERYNLSNPMENMSARAHEYIDRPDYDSHFLKIATAGSMFILAPVFILLMVSESQYFGWLLLLWISVPVCIFSIPYLLVIPAVITVDHTRIVAKHGLWKLKIPLRVIEYTEIVAAPPSWVNNHYMFPNAQWVHFRKTKGLFKSWYVPATSATRFILAVQNEQNKKRGDESSLSY